MNRGTVMELGRKNTVVLTPDGQFVHIRKETHHRIGTETAFSTGTHLRMGRHWIASGLSAAALLILFLGLWTFRTPPVVAYVTMDINPSIELGLDAKERVRVLRAVNDDADFIVEGVSYRGRALESVMADIAEKLLAKNLLTMTNGQIVIASVPVKALDDSWETEVTYKMKQVLLEAAGQDNVQAVRSLHITTVSLPAEVREEAEVNGVSSGKMAFWLIADSQGHELSIDTLKSESLKNIAASWGNVDEIMSDHGQTKETKREWNKLLKQAKKNKKLSAESERNSPAASGEEDTEPAVEPKPSEKPAASDKPQASDKPKPSGDAEQGKKSGDVDKSGRSGEDKPKARQGNHDDDHVVDRKRDDARDKRGKVKTDDRKKSDTAQKWQSNRGQDAGKNDDRNHDDDDRDSDD